MNNEIKRLYLIGAGASCPYGLPTLRTLLWDLCEYAEREEREILKQAIYETCGVTLERPEDSPDFEEFLNRLDARSLLYLDKNKLDELSSLRPRAAHIALESLRKFIHQKSLSAAKKEGPYDCLVRSLNCNQAIVSFNWDVLLEVAFRRVGRGYTYLRTKRSKDATLLLRPHGCISWFALLEREGLIIDVRTNVGVLGDDLTHYMLYLKDPLGPRDMGESTPIAKAAVSPLAAIVPPDAAKILSVGGPASDRWVEMGHLKAMKAVWSVFGDLVTKVNEIVVIGYSLPGADGATIEVMKEFVASPTKGNSPKRLLIVDKDEKVVERYRRIVCPRAELVCNDFSKFDPKTL